MVINSLWSGHRLTTSLNLIMNLSYDKAHLGYYTKSKKRKKLVMWQKLCLQFDNELCVHCQESKLVLIIDIAWFKPIFKMSLKIKIIVSYVKTQSRQCHKNGWSNYFPPKNLKFWQEWTKTISWKQFLFSQFDSWFWIRNKSLNI